MSVTLKLDNYTSVNIKEQATLDADAPIGSTGLTLTDNQGFAVNDYVAIGISGSETTEIKQVGAVTAGTGITLGSPTTLTHNRFDPIMSIRGNRLKIYTAPNVNGTQPADSAFTTLLTTIDIDPDQLSTIYVDPSGGSDTWYKYTVFNSTSNSESSLADSNALRGGSVAVYCSIDDIRGQAGFERNRNISDSKIAKFRAQATDFVNGSLVGLYTLPLPQPINGHISRITTMLAAGYLQIDQLGQTYNSGPSGTNAYVAWAESELLKLKDGSVELTDANGTTTTSPNANGFSGYPNSVDTPDDEPVMFENNMISGYDSRKY